MYEWIMREEKDMDGVDCYVKTGEVVRCEKCCFAKPFNDVWFQPKRDTLWCLAFMEEREPEWFCANAERRIDETD